jgi:hypothetical protein
MKKIVLFVSLLFLAFTLTAQETEGGITQSDDLVFQASTLPEALLSYTKGFNFPFLQTDNPLMSGNNIDLALTAEVTPISLTGIVNAVWTPIAFFQFSLGGKLGSGWNLPLFGMELRGIGLNENNGGTPEYSGSGFDGVQWRAQAGAALQMDMAALIPGDWNHVVMRTYHEINHKGYSRAVNGESWYYQHDAGENRNGFNYYGNLQLGYQMPLILNMVALQAEADLYLTGPDNRDQWGDDKVRWTFSGILNFGITDNFSAMVITQFRTRRNFVEGKESESEALNAIHYQYRNLDASDPIRLAFYRVALGLTYKL